MHIKQVIIRGFKTYKDQVNLGQDFDPRVNVIVGFNGSGKTNLFNAILFVISDHYGTLRQETRRSLLHEGAGPAVLTAFVEIVFDNSDKRMPIDRDEVRIRRTIGVKKDDYSLDGKNATKNEIFNLLESCGFTKHNPYYIVQQGKIAELTLMDDRRRLELLKEISGASVYDERKAESKKLLDEIASRSKKTDEIIEAVSNRIKNLEEEQKELVEYQQLEKQRRCLEYELTDRDFRTVQERIDAQEADKRALVEELHKAQREAAELRSTLGEVEASAQQDSAERQRLSAEHEQAEKVRAAQLDELTRAKLEFSDESRRTDDAAKSKQELQTEAAGIQSQCAQLVKELEEQKPALAEENARLGEIVQRKQVCEAQRGQLFAKKGRSSQYSSVQQRNKALREEVKSRTERRDRAAGELREAQASSSAAQAAIQQASNQAKTRRVEAQRLEQELSGKVSQDLAKIGEQLENWAERRRLLMQDKDKKNREKEEAERQASQLRARIDGSISRSQRNALSEVKKWVATRPESTQSGVYGSLLENIEVPASYSVAAESTAGQALFNVLVRDADIAGQIVSQVRQGNWGSIVCTPLEQLERQPRQYPQIQGVKPLVEVVLCEEWAFPAVQQVFGRTVVCSNLELADEVSRKYGLDAITLEGDKVSSRGTLTGGYQDPSRFTRLSNMAKMRSLKAKVAALQPQLEKIGQEAQEAYDQLDSFHSQRRTLQDERGQRQSALIAAAEAADEAERRVSHHEEAARRLSERCNELQSRIAQCEAAMKAMEAELQTKSLGDLTQEEEQQLQQLGDELQLLDKSFESATAKCHQLERDLKDKDQQLQGFLRRRLHEIEAELRRNLAVDHQERLRERQNAAERLERTHRECSDALRDLFHRLQEKDKALSEKRAQVEKLQAEDRSNQTSLNELTSKLDEIALNVNNLVKRRGEADEKLRNLTVVSADMAKYKGMTPQQLMKNLGTTNKSLSKFEHVNKKAIDQFTTFTDQLEELLRKRKVIIDSRDAILEFISTVDGEKDATLKRTLERVDQHFREIFSVLVNGGKGKLRMVSKADEALDADDTQGNTGEDTHGVRIEVSFTGQDNSFLTMSQLSGGQKTVVAISLIFAIQRLDPAPFYLFDEIDAALDAQYRTAIAKLIEQDAANAQMVLTTFRPEIIDVAHRFYRVYQKNRVSRVECVPQQEAKTVIEEQTRLEGQGMED